MPEIQAIVANFPVGSFESYTPVEVGLIHKTYRVETNTGTFCLQGLHPKLATDEILADYKVVTGFLAERDFPAPRLVETSTGAAAWDDEDETRWRMTTWLSGKTYNAIQSEDMAVSAASMLGRFHAVMDELDYTFQTKHPLHQTRYHLECMQKAAEKYQASPWFEKVKGMIEEVEEVLPSLLLPTLPQRVVHGDPKISNILFDDDLQACAVIDLDTCCRHSVLVDLGDAVRSWCREGSEDEEKELALPWFAAMMKGYAQGGLRLTAEELAWLPKAGRLITLELSARFLADTLEDSYFGWDQSRYSSRREHNFARAKGMIHLARDMQTHQGRIEEIVAEYFTPV